MKKPLERDTISQMSQESSDSREPPSFISAGGIRKNLYDSVHEETNKAFVYDPDDPSAVKLKEPWQVKLLLVFIIKFF